MHRELFERAAQLATEYLEALPEQPVGAQATREELIAALGGPLPERGEDPATALERFARAMEPGLIAPGYRLRWPPTGSPRPGTRTSR